MGLAFRAEPRNCRTTAATLTRHTTLQIGASASESEADTAPRQERSTQRVPLLESPEETIRDAPA
jgi:hypothetical protein